MNEEQKRREKRKQEKTDWKRRCAQRVMEKQAEALISRYPLRLVGEPESRPCGECQECCFAVGVHELNKPVWTRCEHQCDKGCAIYGERPQSCKDYYCLYQAGLLNGGEELRPDRLGVIFDFRSDTNDQVNLLSVWEVRENAVESPSVVKILRTLSHRYVVFVRRYNSTRRTILGPQEVVKRILPMIREEM